jgi:plastocyanin
MTAARHLRNARGGDSFHPGFSFPTGTMRVDRRLQGRGTEKGADMSGHSMKNIWITLAALSIGSLVAAMLTAGHAPASTAVDVGIQNFKYAPPVLTVPVGAVVTWTNHDEEPHTVTSATGTFSSAGLSNDETFTQTFSRPGTYQYFCALHPQMRATVVVR